MVKRLVGFGVLLGALALGSRVEAAPILGSIDFAGHGSPTGGPTPTQYSTSPATPSHRPWGGAVGAGRYTRPTGSATTFSSPLTWGSGSGSVNLLIGPSTLW